MAEAFASTVITAPVEAVWACVRDFNGMPSWNPNIIDSAIEGGLAPDVVGCIRAFGLAGGVRVRERLLSLDDSRYSFSYNFETPAFPVENYVAEFDLVPVTNGEHCYAQWRARFDEAPEDKGRFGPLIGTEVFAAGLRHLADAVAKAGEVATPPRWQGLRPAKVFCSSVLHAPVDAVWAHMRDFAGMGGWHDEISEMHMLDGARADRIGGVRDFRFGADHLQEQLTLLCDRTYRFRYKINTSPMPWLNYHAGASLFPITSSGETLGVWTADWIAAPNDDVKLIADVHGNVFQRAFDTLNRNYCGSPAS